MSVVYRLRWFLVLLLGAVLGACENRDPLDPTYAVSRGGLTGGAPTNLRATIAFNNDIALDWEDHSTNEDGWEVHRSTAGPGGPFTLFTVYPWPNVTTGGNSGLQPATQYCYEVRAYKGARRRVSYSLFSNVACATTPRLPPPDAPFATNATPQSSTAITVTWVEQSSRDGFRIERSLDRGATWITAGTASANAYSYGDTGRTADQEVCYRVFAFNAHGESPPSNTDCTTPPAAPTGLTASGLDGPAVTLAWADNSAVASGFEVRRSTDGVTFAVIGTVYQTTYVDGAVIENTTYWYAVRARKDGGFSDLSNVAGARSGALTLPLAPSLDAWAAPWRIDLWWASSINSDGFEVERCDVVVCGDADFQLIATLGPNGHSTADYAVAGGSTYAYRVRAFNRAGYSAHSNLVSVTACVVVIDGDGTYVCG